MQVTYTCPTFGLLLILHLGPSSTEGEQQRESKEPNLGPPQRPHGGAVAFLGVVGVISIDPIHCRADRQSLQSGQGES